VINISEKLVKDNFQADYIHKDLSLKKRQQIVDDFKAGKFQVLVATEVLGRGIDVPNLPVVVIFDIPYIPEQYVHMIGRTGRAGNEGTSYAFLGKDLITLHFNHQVVQINEGVLFEKK